LDPGTKFFWGLITVLVGASGYFGTKAEERRRELQKAETALVSDDIVRLSRVVDGDTVLVSNGQGQTVPVRILGIKAFNHEAQKDPAARFGLAAMDSLRRAFENKSARVVVGSPAKDKHGRTLAELHVNDEDVGLSLVREGVALVYTAFPFASMPLYLEEQAAARAERRGFWADPEIARRADLLVRQWRRGAH
jgi:endonuclease YncB( thermonuclease family)